MFLSGVAILAVMPLASPFAPNAGFRRSVIGKQVGFYESVSPFVLCAVDEDQVPEPEESTSSAGETSSEDNTEEIAVEESEEDPEIIALKEEIKNLESSLKSKRNTLGYTQDQVELYSKAGYARKVAEMENMRRIRSSMNTSNKSSATAAVLADFLPVFDRMNELKQKYANDEFGSGYTGLTMVPTFQKLGVQEYSVESGEKVDISRMSVVEEELSTDFAKDTVIRVLNVGMELDGNVIRAADVVVSTGGGNQNENRDESNEQVDEAV